MNQVEPKNLQKNEKQREEAAKRVQMIANQWLRFSKTAAYKEFRDYIDMQDEFALMGAKGPINTFIDEKNPDSTFDLQKATFLLQRSVGYDIVKTYVDGYVNLDT